VKTQGFELHQVLNYRRELEKLRHQEFAEAKHELDLAEKQLQREVERTSQVLQEMQEKQQAGIEGAELQLYSNFGRRQQITIKEQQQAVSVLDQEVEERRETLLDAAKDKKMMEKFRDRQNLAHQLELAAKERSFLDELSVQKSGQAS
jgi:flagellar FliJ protein